MANQKYHSNKKWVQSAKSKLFDCFNMPILLMDISDHIVGYNQNAAEWIEKVGIDCIGMSSADFVAELRAAFRGSYFKHGQMRGIALMGKNDSYEYYLEERHDFSMDGNKAGYFLTYTNITAVQERIRQLDMMASHDQMTGLYNRRMCDIVLEDMDQPESYPLAVLIGDVNNLKQINDTYGHDKGDQAILAIADILKRYIPEDGFAARLGGDEFLIAIPCMNERGCQMFIKLVENKCLLESSALGVTLSISLGYKIKNRPGQSIAEIKSIADHNMYTAKLAFKTKNPSPQNN